MILLDRILKDLKKCLTIFFIIMLIFSIRQYETFASEPVENSHIAVSELDLGEYDDEMKVGNKQLLCVTVLPVNASDSDIKYASSDEEVATVNGMGRISALSVGITTITVSCGKKSSSFVLKVIENIEENNEVTDIEIDDYEDELLVNESITLKTKIIPTTADSENIVFHSSDEKVATVNTSGEVKGISPGVVTINISAGKIEKKIVLNVRIRTETIALNSKYVILRVGQRFQIISNVLPENASQNVNYKSLDSEIATVSSDGMVTARKSGNTSIMVSTKDVVESVSIIINQDQNQVADYGMEEEKTEQNVFDNIIYADKIQKLDTQMLLYYYNNKIDVQIIGNGYVMKLVGSDIRNYKNELYTDIHLLNDEQGIHFKLNEKNNICGEIRLSIKDVEGQYLYLYNQARGKYELIETDNIGELHLTSSGQYLITKNKLKIQKWSTKIILVIGGGICTLGIIIYIIVKRKYWFW